MDEKVFLKNETSVESVTTYPSSVGGQKGSSGAMTYIAIAAMFALSAFSVYIVPMKAKVAVGFIAFIIFTAMLIGLFRGRKKLSGHSDQGSIGIVSTGDATLWSYSFCENKLLAENGKEKLEIDYSDFKSIRDIGASFQLTHSGGRLIIKKEGFSEGGEEKFRYLMQKNGININ